MPKQPGGISKSTRKAMLLKVFKTWGRSSKQELDERMARTLNVEKETISRALYRDLQEMVTENQLIEERRTPAGEIIEDYDPSMHKNTICEWWLTEEDATNILGAEGLRKAGGSIICSPKIRRQIKISEALKSNKLGVFWVYFSAGGQTFALEIDQGAIIVNLLIARYKFQDEAIQILNTSQERFDSRLIILLLPDSKLSSIDTEGKQGHCLITFESENNIIIRDLNSKNGTEVVKIDSKFSEEIVSAKYFSQGATLSLEWLHPHLKVTSMNTEPAPNKKPGLKTTTPLVVHLSDTTNLILI